MLLKENKNIKFNNAIHFYNGANLVYECCNRLTFWLSLNKLFYLFKILLWMLQLYANYH